LDRLIAFVATARPDESRAFYRDILGLTFVEESPYAIVFTSGETMLRIQKVDEVPPPTDTALGWEVDDIAARMAELAAKGIAFERFDGFGQDASGIWTAPDGTTVAWFRDPDGNRLSLTQFAR
jgi:catechol 2,3-dioxygenase-like lactoylglutathione lyase family enzyme